MTSPTDPDQPATPRTRVVLAEVASGTYATRPAGATVSEVEDILLRGLVRAQLALAVRLAIVVLVGLGSLPLLFALAPNFGAVTISGVRLPWLLRGVLAYPFLIVIGAAFVRFANHNERDFAALQRREHEARTEIPRARGK
jgi:uncharacterized membrane protein (DUF485 family)